MVVSVSQWQAEKELFISALKGSCGEWLYVGVADDALLPESCGNVAIRLLLTLLLVMLMLAACTTGVIRQQRLWRQ